MIEVRPATSADIEAMAALHSSGWREGFAGIVPPDLTPSPERLAQRMRERFAERPGGRLVAEIEGELRGFCFFGPSRDERADPAVGEIYVLFVAPASWRTGVGLALVKRALEELAGFDEVTLWSAAENHRANAFYEALGFARDGADQLRPEFGNVREVRYRQALPRPP
jgi:ribosomal protein S18 acetylase RimI-like enzyme